MAVYGQFETVAELGRSGPCSAWRARLADGGWDLGFNELGSDANYVVKVFHVRNGGGAEEADAAAAGAAQETARFLDCVRAHKRVADAGARHWAPVFEAGATPRGDAFYVTQFYPRTAATLLRSPDPIDGATLYAIVAGAVDGLLELRRAVGRPHGNLKPGNVLIDARPGEAVTPDRIRLADPARQQDATIAGEVEDLFNLGELIHELVLRQRFTGQQAWPVPPSARWGALGKLGGRWLAFCNRLLSPRGREQWLRIDEVLDDVVALRPPPARFRLLRSRKTWAAAAVLAVVTALGAAEYVHYTRAWRDLCGAYNDWLGPIDRHLAKDTPKEIAQDPYLNDHLVKPLADARATGVVINPQSLASSNQPLPLLAQQPPLGLGVIWQTEKAWKLAQQIDQTLSPAHWRTLADLVRRGADYDKRGWPNLAQYAALVSESLRRERGADWTGDITTVVQGAGRLARLDDTRAAARTRLDRLVGRARDASALRETIGLFEARLRVASDADAPVPTADAVDSLARQIRSADRDAATFEPLIPGLAEVAKLQRAYELRGWANPARHLGALIDRARPTADVSDLPAALSRERRDLDNVENLWKQIEERRRILEASGDRMLATYHLYVAQQGHLAEQADPAALARALNDLNDQPTWTAAAAKASEDEWARIDPAEFALHSKAHHDFAGRSVATPQDLAQWLTDLDTHNATQLASATLNPESNHRADRPPVESILKPSPTTVASASTGPSTRQVVVADASSKPAPPPPPPATRPAVAVASANPPPATQKSPPLIATATTNPTTRQINNTAIAYVEPRPGAISQPVRRVPSPGPTSIAATQASPRTSASSQPSPTTVAVKPAPPPQPPQPSPEEIRRQQEVASFIIECREVALNAKNRDVKDAWRARNDQIADAVQRNPSLYTPALKARRTQLRNRLLQVDGAIRDVAAPLALKLGEPAWNAPLARALATTAPGHAAAIKDLIDLALAGDGSKFDPAFAALIGNDQEWRAAAARFLADANRAQQLLEDGYVPNDRTTNNAALSSTLSAVRTSELYQTDVVRDALEPLLRPVSVIETQANPGALRLLADAADQPLGIRFAAWAKTGSTGVSRQVLESDLKTAHDLLDASRKRITDKSRVESIRTRLDGDVRARWTWLLDNALRDGDVEAAIALRDRIPGVDPAQLSPRARFNFALHDLRGAVASTSGDDVDQHVAPAVQAVRRAAAGLDAGQSRQLPVLTLLAQIEHLGQDGKVEFSQLGPMSDVATRRAASRIRWSVAADEAGEAVTYRGTLPTDGGGEGSLALVFRRVHPGGAAAAASRSSWVCTTEVSLGVFMDLLSASGKWSDLRASHLLPEYDPAGADPRKGPRTWEWPRYGRSGDITWTRVWLSVPGFVPPRLEHYPPEIAADFNATQIGNPRTRERDATLNPSRRMPMQYLSARAAQFAAALAGCRLPTVAEWQAAHKSTEQAVGVNLRDRTWRLELDHLAQRGFGGRCRPDAGIFVPAGEQPSNAVWQHPNGGEINDGTLWFREVPVGAGVPPSVFVDLVGNVAEFVTAAPGDGGGKLYVIGGSALSPPGRKVDQAFDLPGEQAGTGFSDVGFRLAFSEPPPSLAKLKDSLAGNWYLTAR
ncbi:MAG TPA: hypothetical protein VH475_10070 [Tepidisphaeraceae bacterium]